MRRAVHDDVARGPDAGHQADEAQERHRGRGTAPCRRCGLQASREPSSSAGPYDHPPAPPDLFSDRKSTRLNSSHMSISYAVFCLKKKKIFFTFIKIYAYSIIFLLSLII